MMNFKKKDFPKPYLTSLLLFLPLLLLPCLAVSQTSINIDQSLVAGDKESTPWKSPSGEFAFGFKQLDNNKPSFVLAIWYDKIPEKTIVWYPRKSNQLQENTLLSSLPEGSKLELTSDRGLLLTGSQGDQLWNSDPIVSTVSSGVMNDTGNFLLLNNDSETLWSSFDNPTDTLLPLQAFPQHTGVLLSSKVSETNFSQGRFQLLLQDGVVKLTTINIPTTAVNEAYYQNEDPSTPNPSVGIGFNESGYLYLVRKGGQVSNLTPGNVVPAAKDYYLRATLEYDGVFIQYSYPKDPSASTKKWSPIWFVPDNICVTSAAQKGSGTCGYNRICRLDVNHRPVCDCPRGFSLVDQTDDYRGCVPDYSQGCGEDAQASAEDLFTMDELNDIDWPFSDYEFLTPFTHENCRDSCLRDCMCAVAIFRDKDKCWKKKLPLSNGRVQTDLDSVAFIKRRKDGNPLQTPPPPRSGGDNQDTLILAGSVLLGSSVFVNFMLIGAIGLGFFCIYQKKITRLFRDESGLDVNIHGFTYKELHDATNGFKEELGRGSFGIVYKGVLQIGNSKTQVAIKKLDRLVHDSEKEFKTEVVVIGQTHHKNLVRLLGYCNEGPHRLLVYEYLSNGTLASFLFEDLKPSWEQRTQIAWGIGRGLLYLHEECTTQIIHCDIKPQNILLDENYDARIADFGLAKLLLMSQTHTHTAIRGTRGYVAPEWFRNMPITVKVDVYSFGVLLLEIICCRRSIDIESGEEKAILADWAYDCYRGGMLNALVDNNPEAMSDTKRLERFLMVAIWCIQEDPSLRPTMKKVMLMLEGIVQVGVPPCPFTYSTMNSL